MDKNKIQYLTVAIYVALTGFLLLPLQTFGQVSATPTTPISLEELNRAIEQKQQEKKALEEKLQQYQSLVAEKQKASASLSNELGLLDAQIVKAGLDIQALDFTIEEKNLEVAATQHAINQKQGEIDTRQNSLAELVRTINRYDQKDPLELLIIHESFSEVVNDIRATTALEHQVTDALAQLRTAKANLEREQADRERRKQELLALQNELEVSKANLDSQKDYKDNLLTETQSSEQQYSALLNQSRQEQLSADSEIRNLESSIKAKLGGDPSSDASTLFTGNRNVQLAWPVAPLKGISAYFHDTTYPFRKYFEHPAIDIPAPQGTSIAAPDDGYVARAKNGGFGYSYILLVHSNSISTVYGHVSQINVAEDSYVKKGQIIGKSGGLPGTPGAGNLTTGPHLHFEVRLNGIPVNPLDYLP
ncbi:MAG: peptidoglycan DD-metalloendopeptidase family protein [Patescibacteria group bacterium]